MKKLKIIITLIIVGFSLLSCSPNDDSKALNVMSFNIRYDNPRDALNAWDNRKEMVVETIISGETHIVGMQEVLLRQQEYLVANLPDYESYGVGRDDGELRGEMGSIFYKRDRFEVLEKSTFWLSETPDIIGSKGWNAVLPRIVSWVKFHDKENDQDFYFFNTHFSHIGEEARSNSAKLLVSKVAEITGGYAVIISGDFNCTNDSEPYKILTKPDNNTLLFDTQLISESEHFGGMNSINSFGRSNREAIIDYLFCNSGFEVQSHGILTIKKDSVFVSDHYPVVATIGFQ